MCYVVVEPFKEAQDDVECFKVMKIKNGKLISEFHNQHIKYLPGDTISAAEIPAVILPFKCWFKRADFKRKLRRKMAADIVNNKRAGQLFGEVVHSFCTKSHAFSWRWPNECVVRCVIPKGEIYWHNPNSDQYASFSVRIVEVLQE